MLAQMAVMTPAADPQKLANAAATQQQMEQSEVEPSMN